LQFILKPQEFFVKQAVISIIILALSLLLPLAGTSATREMPTRVGGFILGSDVTDYPQIEYSNFLKEVVIYNWNGFAKGIISYGICDSPGEIVRIKLKYKDSSKSFFKTLLKKYKQKYGKPDEWKGDSFGILHIWKWKFVNDKGEKIYLILQHNTKNQNENTGNMVKLYCPDQIVKEQKCFNKQCNSGLTQETKGEKAPELDWNVLIPQSDK
jgi:hypothetical protein